MSSKLFLFSAVVVSGIAVPALADLTHTFDSYHAFCVYGGGSGMQWWQSDAAAMAGRFGAAGYDAHLYGPGQSTGNLSDALTDMVSLSQARPNELIVFYYSGHGNFHDPVTGIGGLLDTNNDESQAEDPGGPDLWDESFQNYDNQGTELRDDDFGWYINLIQANCCWVSGILDMCGANGQLDGGYDVGGWAGKESLWMSSSTEWEKTSASSPLTTGLLADPFGPGATLGDLSDWFWDTALAGHTEPETWGIKLYEEDLSSTKDYFPPVPEPTTLSLLALGGLAMLRHRRTA